MRIVSARAARLVGVAAFLLLLGTTSASAAPLSANRIVTIQNFAFSPATITVNVGDSITWTNTDAAIHSARATGGSFDTGTLSEGQSKTITFSVPGTFGYICGIHGASMSGTVVVNGQVATPVPTATPKPVPTAPSLAPTDVPTAAPTAPPTAPPTVAPTAPPPPSPTVATTAPATPSPTTPAPRATQISAPSAPSPSSASVAATNASGPTAAAAQAGDSGPGPLLVAGGAVIVVGLIGLAVVLLRR